MVRSPRSLYQIWRSPEVGITTATLAAAPSPAVLPQLKNQSRHEKSGLDLEEIRKDGSETEAGRLSAPPPIGAMGYRRALQEFTNRRAWRALQQHRQRVFDQILESGEELRADGAVDSPVIAGERAAHHGCDRQRAVLHHRPLLAGA